jgi:hypothetical protein
LQKYEKKRSVRQIIFLNLCWVGLVGSPLGVEILEMVLVGWVGGSPPAAEILEIFFPPLTGRANLGNLFESWKWNSRFAGMYFSCFRFF